MSLSLPLVNLQIAPTASPGLRGAVMEFTSRFLVLEIAKTEGRARKTRGLVS